MSQSKQLSRVIVSAGCLVFGVWVEIGFGGNYSGVYLIVDVSRSGDSMD